MFNGSAAAHEAKAREYAEAKDILWATEYVRRAMKDVNAAAGLLSVIKEETASHTSSITSAQHVYSSVRIRGEAEVGDKVASDWRGPAIGYSHHYSGVKVVKGGKAVLGNQFGGEGFWDH